MQLLARITNCINIPKIIYLNTNQHKPRGFIVKSLKSSKYLYFFMGIFGIGLISRILPLFMGEARILQQFPTEDGYLMLTIARNMALGLGMSTADGTILTNGTQPFVTFVWALGYVITGGSKLGGVIFAHIIQLIISILFAIVTFKLARKVFKQENPIYAFGLSAILFASPQLLPHSMNFLETGTYVLFISWVILEFYEENDKLNLLWSFKKCIAIGVLLGALFWIRIDSVFIIFACCIAYLYRGISISKHLAFERLKRTLVFGSISVLVASPWLIYNYVFFGSIMPISGQAQNARALAQNASIVPSTLVEYLLVFLPIPLSLQEKVPVIIGSILLLVSAAATAIRMYVTTNIAKKSLIIMGATVIVLFAAYYGILFGAKHFVGRYLAATSPFFALLSLAVFLYFKQLIKDSALKNPALFAAATCTLGVVIGLNYRIFALGVPQDHIQVVNWIEKNVPDEAWVAAVQTGTLGYFHDKTLNLDGKVNPEALKAKHGKAYCPENDESGKERNNCLMHYIVKSEIQYIADWQGIAGWAKLPPLLEYFDLIVDDEKKNLAVFRRHGAPTK